jgi:hypothetical protein
LFRKGDYTKGDELANLSRVRVSVKKLGFGDNIFSVIQRKLLIGPIILHQAYEQLSGKKE